MQKEELKVSARKAISITLKKNITTAKIFFSTKAQSPQRFSFVDFVSLWCSLVAAKAEHPHILVHFEDEGFGR
jgi:hypothetical protein